MALLARNLLVCFLFSLLAMFMALLWFMEHRHPRQDYSEIVERLNNNQIVRLQFTGNKVAFTDRDGHTFVTTVPNVSKFLERVQEKNIRVTVREDRFNLIYLTIIAGFLVSLIMVVWWSLQRNKKEESKFASDKLVSLRGKELGITFKDIAGIPEAKEEMMEVVSFLKYPDTFKKLVQQFPEEFCCRARQVPVKPCCQEPWPVRLEYLFTASAAQTLWKCSWESEPLESEIFSRKQRKTIPALSLLMK